MARTVADAAALLSVLAGVDEDDAATANARIEADYTAFVGADGLRGTRIGVARHLAGFNDRVDLVFDDTLDVLRSLGPELVDPVEIPHVSELEEPEVEVLRYEFKTDLEAYLASLPAEQPYRTLADLISFNVQHADVEMPHFAQEQFELTNEKGPLTEPAYRDALATCRRLSRDEGLDAVFGEHRVDAIVAPSNAPAWLTDYANGDHYVGGNSTPAAVSGYPNVTVPAGFAFDLPLGLSFIGRPWTEGTLIRLASAFEHATGRRRVPDLRPRVAPGSPSAENLTTP
jgi:amidase